MDILVGHTGFVGSNLTLSHQFDRMYNSKNIEEAYQTSPDLCVYSGVRAEMFLANHDPDADLEIIKNAIYNIQQINPKYLVLISTIAVYDNPVDVTETTVINAGDCSAYGRNRLYLENWVRNHVKDYLIVRLPAIYGESLKKNFVYDLIHVTPALLKPEKFAELCAKDDFIKDYYILQDNGFYKCTDSKTVKPYFEKIGFSALNFTDSRSVYQFYPLKKLWEHIRFGIEHDVKTLNIATEPISAAELYFHLYQKEFINEISPRPFCYDMKTNYFETGYIYNKRYILDDIKGFIENHK